MAPGAVKTHLPALGACDRVANPAAKPVDAGESARPVRESDTLFRGDRLPAANDGRSDQCRSHPLPRYPRRTGVLTPEEPTGGLGVPERRGRGGRGAPADGDTGSRRGGRNRGFPTDRRVPQGVRLRVRSEREDHPQDGSPVHRSLVRGERRTLEGTPRPPVARLRPGDQHDHSGRAARHPRRGPRLPRRAQGRGGRQVRLGGARATRRRRTLPPERSAFVRGQRPFDQ